MGSDLRLVFTSASDSYPAVPMGSAGYGVVPLIEIPGRRPSIVDRAFYSGVRPSRKSEYPEPVSGSQNRGTGRGTGGLPKGRIATALARVFRYNPDTDPTVQTVNHLITTVRELREEAYTIPSSHHIWEDTVTGRPITIPKRFR